MTLLHKPTEKPRRKGLIVLRNHNYIEVVLGRNYTRYKSSMKWCYLSDLLKLERENERLKKELEKFKPKPQQKPYKYMVNIESKEVNEAMKKAKEEMEEWLKERNLMWMVK